MIKLTLFLLFILCSSTLFGAQKLYNDTYYTSSNSVEGLLKIQKRLGYDEYKRKLQEDYNLNIAGDYHIVYFGADNSIGNDNSIGGVARLFGEWQFINQDNQDKGSIVFKVENRHKFSDVSPLDFGSEIGYAGLLQSTYTDQGNRLTTLYYKQNYLNGRLTTYSGFLDSTEYLDIYLLISPWNAFGNLVFATGSATIAGMPDGALGVMGAYWLNDKTYVVGSIVDANGNPTHPVDGFESFFKDFETLKTLEFGFTTSKDQLFFDNFHITLWQIDERNETGISEGYGVSFSLTHTLDKKWFTFLRGGYSKDGGAILSKSISFGFGHFGFSPNDIYAIGLNLAKPNEEFYGDGVNNQYTSEVFYRYQAYKHIQITPSLQSILNPALNEEKDFMIVFGLRLEVSF